MRNIYFDRELSWLSFNSRLLQEAADESNPLFERLKFLSIYSANLDEFLRTRVIPLRSLLMLPKASVRELDFNPVLLLGSIKKNIFSQQNEFSRIYRESILPALERAGVTFLAIHSLDDSDKEFLDNYFNTEISNLLDPIIIKKKKDVPELKNNILYLAVRLAKLQETKSGSKHFSAFVEIPSDKLPRLIKLPTLTKKSYIFLDDVIRINLKKLFPGYRVIDSFSIKLIRDNELFLDEQFPGSIRSKIIKALSLNKNSVPCHLFYDGKMPANFLKFLRDILSLEKEDLVSMWRYHNFVDFLKFKNPGIKELEYPKTARLKYPKLNENNIFDVISAKDLPVYYPYFTFDHFLAFIKAAASDPKVRTIKLTLMGAMPGLKLVKELMNAAISGKLVTAIVGTKTSFGDEKDLGWAYAMQNSGVRVIYNSPGLNLHAKAALITRFENYQEKEYAYFATGNINESDTSSNTDFALFTSDAILTWELKGLFELFEEIISEYKFSDLLVSGYNLRKKFSELIDNEIKNAVKGLPAGITLKLNHLEDKKLIRKLYEASNAGVKINIIVRGVCVLVPALKGQSSNIKVISIVDRFLEQSRFYIFENGGEQLYFSGSADWMRRNFKTRTEIVFPVKDVKIKELIGGILKIYLKDNVKARIINMKGGTLKKPKAEKKLRRSQTELMSYLKTNLLSSQ